MRNLLVLIISISALSVCAQPSKSIDKIIAVVSDEIVLQSQLEEQFTQYSRSGQTVGPNTRCKLAEELLFQKLLVDQAKIDSLVVSEEEVEGEIERRIQFFIQQVGSEKRLEEFYGKTVNQMREEFKPLIKDQLLVQRMRAQITNAVDVTPREVRQFYNDIPTDSLPYINSEVELAQIVIKPPISEQEKIRIKERLNGFRDRILKGEDFGTIAYLYSEDPGSAKKNGELGYLTRGQLVPEFAAVAFNLAPGQTSEIVETEYGFHLIQMIDKKGQQMNSRHILLTPKVLPGDLIKAKAKLDSIRKEIMAHDSVNFEQMALRHSDDKETRQNGGKIINAATGETKFEMDEVNQIDPGLFYVLDKMKPGDISAPTIRKSPDGKQAYRLVKLISISEPHRANLKDDYQRIRNATLSEREKSALSDWFDDKVKRTYVRMDDQFNDCDFEYDWWK